MINKSGGQTILFKLLSRERKADFESGLSSFLIIEEITEQRTEKHRSSVVVHCLDFFLTFCFFCSCATAIFTR